MALCREHWSPAKLSSLHTILSGQAYLPWSIVAGYELVVGTWYEYGERLLSTYENQHECNSEPYALHVELQYHDRQGVLRSTQWYGQVVL